MKDCYTCYFLGWECPNKKQCAEVQYIQKPIEFDKKSPEPTSKAPSKPIQPMASNIKLFY